MGGLPHVNDLICGRNFIGLGVLVTSMGNAGECEALIFQFQSPEPFKQGYRDNYDWIWGTVCNNGIDRLKACFKYQQGTLSLAVQYCLNAVGLDHDMGDIIIEERVGECYDPLSRRFLIMIDAYQ